MFHKFKKTKGAVSIFLIIILLPMLTASSIFVDVSKFVLAQSLAESAGDLTLNTVLTNYDRDLNEFFGLIASAQDIDTILTGMEDFFVSSMVSQEISEDDAQTAWDTVSGAFGGSSDGISDFLGLSAEEFAVTEIDNGSLANPALMKTQIVEFMKYRGPANALADFVDALTDLDGKFDDTDEITEMTNNKNEFYKAESELMQALYDLYNLLKQYDAYNITKEMIETIGKKTGTGGSEYKDTYVKIHKKIVFDLHNTGSKGVYSPSYPAKYADFSVEPLTDTVEITVTTEVPADPDDPNSTATTKTETQEISEPDIEQALINAAVAIQNYETAKSSFYGLCRTAGIYDSSNNDIYSSNAADIHELQYWAQTENIFAENWNIISGYLTAANNVTKAVKQLDLTYEAITDESTVSKSTSVDLGTRDGVNAQGTAAASTHYNTIKNQYNNNIKGGSFVRYKTVMDRLVTFSKDAVENVPDSLTEFGSAKTTATNNAIYAIYEESRNYHTTLSNASSKLNEIINHIDTKIKPLLADYDTKFDTWETSAYKLSADRNQMVRTDQEEITAKKSGTISQKSGADGGKSEAEALIGKIEEADVNKLYDRMVAINNIVNSAAGAIEACKYFGKSVKDIKDLATAISAANINATSFFESGESGLNKLAENISWGEVQKIPAVDSSNNPKIETGELKLRDILYDYFKDYKPEETTEDDKAEDFQEQMKQQGDDATNNLDFGALIATTTELKDKKITSSSNGESMSGKKTNALSEIATFVGNLFSNFSGTISQALVDMRDDLLISDYIMSMFSYDTFEVEGKLEYAVEEKGYNITTATDWLSKIGQYSDGWGKADDKTFSYDKTLRNNLISTDTCYSYGNEVEYVLYGGSNADNKSKAYSSIYMIRFALDIPAVFSGWWNDPMVVSAAAAVSAATWGIIPAPLVKLVICLAMTAVEAACDLAYLKSGIGIKLLKLSKDDLFTKITTEDFSGEISSDNASDAVGIGLTQFQYSDYLRLFLILNLMGSGEDGICARTADVIQANMQVVSDSSFDLTKSQVYFKISAKLRVKPLMLALPINADENGNLVDVSSWNTFNFEMIRGY